MMRLDKKNDSPDTYFLLVYLGTDSSDIQVKHLVFRGDDRAPSEIFKKGFMARGTSLDVFQHVNAPVHMDGISAYVSTSTSRDVAITFPRWPDSDKAFIYEIARPKKGVDVAPAVKEAERIGKLNYEDVDYYLAEKEIAIPHKIKPGQIKGAWEVEIKAFPDESGFSMSGKVYVRTVNEKSYIPNPNFTPTQILSTVNILGRGLTVVGAVADGTRLYQSYQNSSKSRDFSSFFRDTAQVIGGWSGALALGGLYAQGGALVGGPVGAITGGIVGGALGYYAGSNAGDAIYNAGKRVSRTKQAQSAATRLFQNNIHYFGMHPFHSTHSSFSHSMSNAFHTQYARDRYASDSNKYGSDSSKDNPLYLGNNLNKDKELPVTRRDPLTIRFVIESVIRKEMNKGAPSAFSAWFTAQQELGMGSSLSYSEFTQVARMTNLVSSYNSYHPLANIHEYMEFCKEIGGVASRVGLIEDLVNSPEQVCADEYYLCFPGTELKQSLIQQVAHEVKNGYYTHKTLPFFSLHFNNLGYLYPVIHPAYQHTLVGEVIAFLDYWMKGFLNGGVFDETFLNQWHQTANCDEATLRAHLIDLKAYCKTHFPQGSYISLRELMTRYGLDDKESSPSSAYKQPFTTSFRIIAGQEKIERFGNVLLASPSIQVEYSIDLMPDYEQFIKCYQEKHGRLPEDYQTMLACYQRFAEEIKEKLPKLPFCRAFFDLLGVINFYCYFYTTLEKMGKIPLLESITPERTYQVPKAFPPIPVRYYRSHDLNLNFLEVLTKVQNLREIGWLNEAIAGLFHIKRVTQLPSSLMEAIRESILTLIQEKLPQSDINDEEVAKISTVVCGFVLAYVYKHIELTNYQLKPILNYLSPEIQREAKALPLTEKLSFLEESVERLRKKVLTRWEENFAEIEEDSFRVLPEEFHAELKEEYINIQQITDGIIEKINENTVKLPECEAIAIQEQTSEMEREHRTKLNLILAEEQVELQKIQTTLEEMQRNFSQISSIIPQLIQRRDSETAALPTHLSTLNQKILSDIVPLDAEIARLQQIKLDNQAGIAQIDETILRIQQNKNTELASIPPHLRALNQIQIDSFIAERDSKITELNEIKIKIQMEITEINAEIARISQYKSETIASIPSRVSGLNQKITDDVITPLNAEITRLEQLKIAIQTDITEKSQALATYQTESQKRGSEFETEIQTKKATIISDIKQQTEEKLKKFAENKATALSNQQKIIQTLAVALWNGYCDDNKHTLQGLKSCLLSFGTSLVDTQTLSKHRVATKYSYSIMGFSHQDLSKETPHTRHVVGGCSMQLPTMKSEILPKGEQLAQLIENQFLEETTSSATIQWQGQIYMVSRLPVLDKPILKENIDTVLDIDEPAQCLELLVRTNKVSNPVAKETLHHVMDKSGARWVHYASQVTSGEVFEQLIACDPTLLSLQDAFGHTPIYTAITARQPDVLAVILKVAPAQAEALTLTGLSPLMLAVQHGFEEGVAQLLAYNVDANRMLPNGLYPLYLAIHNHYPKVALLLMDRIPTLKLNHTLDNGMTPLHLATIRGLESLALELIKRGAQGNLKRHADGYTAWHCAAEKGHLSILAALIDQGCPVDLALESGKTALHLAAISGQLSVVRYLIEKGCNSSVCDEQGQTALMNAIQAGHTQIAELLAETAQINQTNLQQETASLLAIKYGLPTVADRLIERGERVDLRNSSGKDYLYYVVESGHYLRVESLLQADKTRISQVYGSQSLLDIATRFKQTHVVSLLITLGCQYTEKHAESYGAYLVSVDEVGAFRVFFNALASKILEPWIQRAARSGSSRCLKFLLSEAKGCKWDILEAAILSRNLETLRLAITHAPNLQGAVNAAEDTALHLATALGEVDMVELLITSGCDITLKNKKGQTPFDIAKQQKDEDLFKQLVECSLPPDRPQKPDFMVEAPLTESGNELQDQSDLPDESVRELQMILKIGALDEAIELLGEQPNLLNTFKTSLGPTLFQQVLNHLGLLDESEDVSSQEMPIFKILSLLKEARINPSLYRKQNNPLLNLLKIDDKLAAYRFEQLHRFFPEAVAILLNDKLINGMVFAQCVLNHGHTVLFEKLQALSLIHESQGDNLNLLGIAILCGHLALAQSLYPQGKSHLTHERKTPLILAASTGNTSMVELLLTLGEPVDAVDLQGRNALYHAILVKAEHAALTLLLHLKVPNHPDRQGITPLALASAQGLTSIVRHLCNTGEHFVDYDKQGDNALHQAAIFGHSAVIETLVESGFPINEPQTLKKPSPLQHCQKRTALHLAALHGQTKAVEKLLSLGADPLLEDQHGQTIYEYAVMSKSKGMYDFVQEILPEALKKQHRLRILFAAAKVDQLEIIDEAIIQGEELNLVNSEGRGLLHICAINMSLAVAERLLSSGEMLIDSPDKFGHTPLDYAATVGNVAMIRCLLAAGASREISSEAQNALRQTHSGAAMALTRYGFYQSKPLEIENDKQDRLQKC